MDGRIRIPLTPDQARHRTARLAGDVQVWVVHLTAAASRYYPGQHRDWIKVKYLRHQEVIICGWKPGHGRRADTIGSLLLGVYDGGRLRYAGHVGTGFTQTMLADLIGQLRPLRRTTNPFGTPIPPQRRLR